jgi:hypothetical protein
MTRRKGQNLLNLPQNPPPPAATCYADDFGRDLEKLSDLRELYGSR